MAWRSFPAAHEVRAQVPAECWRSDCHEPVAAGGRGLCEAHLEQARDDIDVRDEIEAAQ